MMEPAEEHSFKQTELEVTTAAPPSPFNAHLREVRGLSGAAFVAFMASVPKDQYAKVPGKRTAVALQQL